MKTWSAFLILAVSATFLACLPAGEIEVCPEPMPAIQAEVEEEAAEAVGEGELSVPPGQYWGRRPHGLLGASSGPVALGQPAGTSKRSRWGDTRCVPVVVGADSVTWGDSRSGAAVELSRKHTDEGEVLRAPRVRAGGQTIWMQSECSHPFELRSSDSTSLLTSAGRLYRTSKACNEVGSSFQEKCEGAVCTITPAGHPLFEAGACEEPYVSHPFGVANQALGVEYDAFQSTVEALDALRDAPATLFARDPVEEVCVEVAVEPEPETGYVVFSSSWRVLEPRPGYRHERRSYTLQPLRRQAILQERGWSVEDLDDEVGGLGMSGSRWGTAPIIVLDRIFHLDGIWYSLSREVCEDRSRYFNLRHGYEVTASH